MPRAGSMTATTVHPDVQKIIEAIARDLARQDHAREVAARKPQTQPE